MVFASYTIRALFAGVLLLPFISVSTITVAQDAPSPLGVIAIEGGKIQGVETDVPGVTVFKGIPYAAPTHGENRFRAPQPVEPWEGVLVADTWGDRAMQWEGVNPVGGFYGDEFYYDPDFMPPISENGLNLNVFTPAQTPNENLPVYMWIHGGANAHGFASEQEFWATKLAAKGIVLVSVQYRVGPFGDLALAAVQEEDPNGIAGNQRIQDLVTALEWIRDNISGFGGDPNSVTVGGQSAGGFNTISLLKSPLARGLFKRAIVQSVFFGLFDGFSAPKEASEKMKENQKALEELFDKPMTLADLRAIPAEAFFSTKVGADSTLLYYAIHNAIGGTVIDGVSFTKESVDLFRPGALDGIDLMIGSVADEGTTIQGNSDGTMELEKYAATMERTYAHEWKEAYPASDPQHAYRLSLRTISDRAHQADMVSAHLVKQNSPGSNVFAYYFDNPPPGRNAEFYGSFHSAELWYFMNSMREWPGQRPWTEKDYRLAETMSTYLANFVKTGNPNGPGLVEWKKIEDGNEFMRFADGYAYSVESTPYPLRDKLNRDVVLKQNRLN
ncbi:MAG: carboxylesterase family protein [Rhodothermaceae bacterium]|nr:carboxylesterase family protein [Rhodothermaceae bacterium]